MKNANAMVGSETRVQCILYPSSNNTLKLTPHGSTLFFFEFLFVRNYCTASFFFSFFFWLHGCFIVDLFSSYIAREESSSNHLGAVFELFTL